MRRFAIVGAGLKVSWATFALLLSACTSTPSTPPSTVSELAYQVSQHGILFDPPRFAELIGSSGLKHDSATRIPGVTLDYTNTRGKYGQIREAQFDLAGACTRLSDLVDRLGEPTTGSVITDGGGLSYAWDILRRGGKVRIGLSGGMTNRHECARHLWVAQPWDLS